METAGRGSRAPCLCERIFSCRRLSPLAVTRGCIRSDGSERFHRTGGQIRAAPAKKNWLAACSGDKTAREQKTSSSRAATAPPFVIVRRKQLKAHFARQIRAKSSQVSSAAAPVSFIFCHSSPHACIRARVAGGKFRGSGWGSRCGVGASIGAAEIAGADGKSIVARPPARPAGRGGGSGAVNDGFGFAAASSANAGQRASCAAAKTSHARSRVNARSASLRGVTTRFAALMAFRSNRRHLGARPGFIQIASSSEHFIPGCWHAAFIFQATPSGVQPTVMAAPPAPSDLLELL
jgi:hypothetical protein